MMDWFKSWSIEKDKGVYVLQAVLNEKAIKKAITIINKHLKKINGEYEIDNLGGYGMYFTAFKWILFNRRMWNAIRELYGIKYYEIKEIEIVRNDKFEFIILAYIKTINNKNKNGR